MKTTLVVLAAGMGSRYGGLKQMDPLGPNKEAILEFSVYDAIVAGFNKVIFIIKKSMEEDFKNLIGNKIAQKIEVEYVFQDLHTLLPEDMKVDENRVKPWGTGHALLCCKNAIHEPFAILNADDFYGRTSFIKVHDYLVNQKENHYALVGYILENTLTENGSVTRGICNSENGVLTHVKECRKIIKDKNEVYNLIDDNQKEILDPKSLVSMNMWGFFPGFIDQLEVLFKEFIENDVPKNPLKAEILIPEAIDTLIQRKMVTIDLLSTPEVWFGVTYQEDKDQVKQNLIELKKQGIYPENLWD